LRRFCAPISVFAQLVAPRAAARLVVRGWMSSPPARLALAAGGARVGRQLRSSLHRHGLEALWRQRCCNCAGGRSARLALAAGGARAGRQLRSSLHRNGLEAILRQRCCNRAGGRTARLVPSAVGARSLRPLRQSRHSHGLRACSRPRMSNCSGGDVARRNQPRRLAGAARLAGAGAMGLASVCHWASPRSCS